MRLSIFPLPGALLFPRAHLPLHIFEPRYRALVADASARDRRIAMIQTKDSAKSASGEDGADLFQVGCVGRIDQVEALDDGRFNLILEGVQRFRLVRELEVATPFRQIEADVAPYAGDMEDPEPLSSATRAALEMEARQFADARGYQIDWEGLGRLDDETLVNGIAQIAPFDVASKQAMLEADTLAERTELIVQLLGFFKDWGDSRATLQ